MKRLAILFTLVLGLGPLSAPCRAENDIAQVQAMIRDGQFGVSRTLPIYFLALGNAFRDQLLALRPGQTWVDLGHGNGFALRQYLVWTEEEFHRAIDENRDFPAATKEYLHKIHLPPLDQRGNVFAIGYHKPDSKGEEELFARVEQLSGQGPRRLELWGARTPRYREITGKFFNEIPPVKIKQILSEAWVVSDFYGILNYETEFLRALSLVLNSMPRDSLLATHIFDHTLFFGKGGEYGAREKGGWPDFEWMNLQRLAWLNSFRGARLVENLGSDERTLAWRRDDGQVTWRAIEQRGARYLGPKTPALRVFYLLPNCDGVLSRQIPDGSSLPQVERELTRPVPSH